MSCHRLSTSEDSLILTLLILKVFQWLISRPRCHGLKVNEHKAIQRNASDFSWDLPSGKHTKKLWKITIFHGTTHLFLWPCSIAIFVCLPGRVNTESCDKDWDRNPLGWSIHIKSTSTDKFTHEPPEFIHFKYLQVTSSHSDLFLKIGTLQ